MFVAEAYWAWRSLLARHPLKGHASRLGMRSQTSHLGCGRPGCCSASRQAYLFSNTGRELADCLLSERACVLVSPSSAASVNISTCLALAPRQDIFVTHPGSGNTLGTPAANPDRTRCLCLPATAHLRPSPASKTRPTSSRRLAPMMHPCLAVLAFSSIATRNCDPPAANISVCRQVSSAAGLKCRQFDAAAGSER
jgi:hypothetical protein